MSEEKQPTLGELQNAGLMPTTHARGLTVAGAQKPVPEAKEAAEYLFHLESAELRDYEQVVQAAIAAATAKLRKEFTAKEDRRDEQEAEYNQKMTKELTAQIADRKKLQEEVEELRQWKKEQMIISADTHYQEIANEIGLTIGDNIAPAILPWIKQAKETNEMLRAALTDTAKIEALERKIKDRIDQLQRDLDAEMKRWEKIS